MKKISPPGSERRQLISENLPVSLCPNIPSSSKNHLSEERMTKIPPSSKSQLICSLVWLSIPRNPKVIPNPLAEVAGKEKVGIILMCSREVKNTRIILDDPVAVLHHIPSV